MSTSNKEKLQKRFDELCELISEGKLIEHDPKMGFIKDAKSIGGALNELKLIEKALELCDGLNKEPNINITVNMSCDKKVNSDELIKLIKDTTFKSLESFRAKTK